MRASLVPVLCLLLGYGCGESTPQPQVSEQDGSLREVETSCIEGLEPIPGSSVVVISFDALRADALGTYGSERSLSPHLDQFAEGALVFDRFYSVAPVTPTSFAGAFTARLPHRVFRRWRLESEVSIAGAFRDAGYETAGFFNNSQLTAERGFDLGFETFEVRTDVHYDEGVVAAAEDWLRSRAHDRPIFLWVHLLSPHSPYEVRAESAHLYDAAYAGRFQSTSTGSFSPKDPSEAERLRQLYDGEVFYADGLFGRLLEALERVFPEVLPIIVVTADHGEEFGERDDYYQHRHLFDETLRIPMMLSHPEGAGVRVTGSGSNVDLWPTLAYLAGVAGPMQGADGWNLAQCDSSSGQQRPIVSVAMTDGEYRGVSLYRGGFRLIMECRPRLELELYDERADPSAKVDLLGNGGVSSVAREEAAAMRDVLRSVVGDEPCDAIDAALRGVSEVEGLDESTVENLRSLGYLQ